MVGFRRLGLAALLLCGLCLSATAQTRAVDPADMTLIVEVEPLPATPMRQEMILLTIHGIYKRHITLERLEQPDLSGFNWMQLGEDHWFESMLEGRPVKNMRRRMAVFPDQTGTLTIGSFHHHLTLLDEDNKWFEHRISSAPVTIEVAPEPGGADWWFPVRRLRVEDTWSNAPDQLKPGEGVLRIVRVSALGASPDMIPPMPELRSPSALIFAHPEKRLVDLTPRGPETIAFWRWTITPTNGHSAILEPIEVSYFDTQERKARQVVITPQRVAFGDITPKAPQQDTGPVSQAELRPVLLVCVLVISFGLGIGVSLRGYRLTSGLLLRGLTRQRKRWQLRRADRCGDYARLRRIARQLDGMYAPLAERQVLLEQLDSAIFSPVPQRSEIRKITAEYYSRLQNPVAFMN